MPIFVDRSGQLFEADEAEAEALAQQGMQPASDEDIARHNEAIDYEEKSALGKAGELGQTGVEGVGRGLVAAPLALARLADPTIDPVAEGRPGYTPQALRRRERHPITSGVGESLPSAAVGIATGGLGTGLAGGAALLGAEAALSGLSQEAIDSVVAKRDFSASAALWNGMLDLAFGAVGYAAGRGARAAFGGADEAVDAAAGAAPRARRRNWLGEIDKGTLPDEGMPGMGRSTAGAAREDFADDVWDEAIKSIDDAQGGKGLAPEAQFLADPKTAEPLTELASAQVADNLDRVNAIVKRDISEAVRVGDVQRAASSWTDEMLDAQDSWALDNVVAAGDQVTAAIREAKTAASVGEGFDAGGFGAKAIKDITAGAARVGKTTGAARFNAINNLKRNVDAVIRDVGNARSLNQGDAGELIAVLRPYTDRLRAGLELEELWGAAAPMQREVNAGWHNVIEPLSRVEARLTERLGKTWGEVGQAARNTRARAGAVGQLLRGSASENREFLRDVAGALDGLDDLAAARQAHGLSRIEKLDDMHRALSEIRQDLNMADVLAVARRKAGESGGGFGAAALDAGIDAVSSKVPFGGIAAKGLKGAAKKFLNSPTMPAPGTPLRRVLDARLKAWSRNPDLADTGYSRRLPAWLREHLRAGGAPIAGPSGPSGGGRPAPGSPPGRGGGGGSPVSLAGLSHADLGADNFRAGVREALRADQGFARTGKPTRSSGLEKKLAASDMDGITVKMRPDGSPWLVDGSHRLDVAREKGMTSLPGVVKDSSGKVIFKGSIPIAGAVGAVGAIEGQAEAAHLPRTPEQQENREQLRQQMEGLTPEEQQIQVRTVEGFGRIGATATQRVKSAVGDLFGAALDPDKPRARSAELRRLDARAEKLGVPRSTARFMGRKTDDLFEAFEARSATIKRIVRDPGALARAMADNLGDLPRLQPEIFSHMVAQTYMTAAYLHRDMPGRAGASILNPDGYPPTYDEIEEWAGKWSGAIHPLEAIDDLAANDLQPEQIDAVKACHPGAYGLFQREAIKHIALVSHRGQQIPQQVLEQIDTALDLDGAGDPVLSWSMADVIKQAEAMAAQQKQAQPQGAPPSPMNFQTPEQLTSSSLASLRPQ